MRAGVVADVVVLLVVVLVVVETVVVLCRGSDFVADCCRVVRRGMKKL